MNWIQNLIYRWQHRNDTPDQKAQELKKAKSAVVEAYNQVKESLKDEPATREMHDAFDAMDGLCDSLEIDK